MAGEEEGEHLPPRPLSWLSIRRDSCRSVPMTCRPPSSTTSVFSVSVTSLYSASMICTCTHLPSAGRRTPCSAGQSEVWARTKRACWAWVQHRLNCDLYGGGVACTDFWIPTELCPPTAESVLDPVQPLCYHDRLCTAVVFGASIPLCWHSRITSVQSDAVFFQLCIRDKVTCIAASPNNEAHWSYGCGI